MPLGPMSEKDRSRLAQLIQGPLIPPATPPKEPPKWNWPADLWKIANRSLRSRWDTWSAPDAKRHLGAHWREWTAGGAAAIACVTLLAVGVRVGVRHDTRAIGLQIQEHQGHLQIRWDAGSDLIRRAQQAKLFITDGADRLFVTLDAERLRRGTVNYARQSERVEFRMALTGPNGQVVEQQTVFFGMPLDRRESHLDAPVPAAAAVLSAAEPPDITGHRSRRRPLAQTGTDLPFTCSSGDTFRMTNAAPGWDTFTCRGNNVWGISRTRQDEEGSARRPNASTTTVTAKPASTSTT